MIVCLKCGAALDKNANMGNICKDCYIRDNAEEEVLGYYYEKYKY